MFLTLTNAAGTLVLDGDIALLSASGLYALNHDVQTVDLPNADGETVVGAKQCARTLTLNLRLQRNIVILRRKLIEICARRDVVLELHRGNETYMLDCTVANASTSASDGSNIGITLFAATPYWRSAFQKIVWISGWEALFEWPVEIPADGIEFGRRTETRIVNVKNEGAVATGMTVVFYARSGITNPALYVANNSRRFIRVVAKMEVGDRIEVNTTRGQNISSATFLHADGRQKNVFPLLDPESEFLQLSPGDNLLRCSADEGENTLDVSITINERFSGV